MHNSISYSDPAYSFLCGMGLGLAIHVSPESTQNCDFWWYYRKNTIIRTCIKGPEVTCRKKMCETIQWNNFTILMCDSKSWSKRHYYVNVRVQNFSTGLLDFTLFYGQLCVLVLHSLVFGSGKATGWLLQVAAWSFSMYSRGNCWWLQRWTGFWPRLDQLEKVVMPLW